MIVDTEIEPPGLDDDEDEGPDRLGVHCGLIEADDTRRAAIVHLPPDADDETVADAMIAAMRGAAALRGPQLLEALRRRLWESRPGPASRGDIRTRPPHNEGHPTD